MNNGKMNSIQPFNKNKFIIGLILFYLGPIGLVVGLIEYPKYSRSRKTFLWGYFSVFILALLIGIIFSIVISVV